MKTSRRILTLLSALVLSLFLRLPSLYANTAPVMNQPVDMTVNEGASADQVITATDADGQPLTFSKVVGPSFVIVTTTNATTANAHVAPGFQEASCTAPNQLYTVTVQASDGSLSDSKSFTITINNANRAPVANAGGPYTTCVGKPVSFNGSATDPDGDPVTFSWDFGDGNTGSGATPSHTYSNPGAYNVTLTVTDNCTPPLSKTVNTTVTVSICQATITRCPSAPPVNLNSAPDACFYIQPVGGCFNATDVNLGTVVMRYGATISTITAVVSTGDNCPMDGITDVKVCFTKTDLNTLFISLPNGTTNVSVTIEGSTVGGCQFQGSSTFDVKK